MRPIFFIFFAAILPTGCAVEITKPEIGGATKAVVQASEEHDVSFRPETYALRLLSASIVEEGGDADRRSHLYLCLSRPHGLWDQDLVLVRIPASYPFANDDHQGYPFKGALILGAGGASDLFKGCDERVGTRLVRQLPIIETKAGETVTLSSGTDAVIVSRRDEGGLGLAYASATPFFGGYHAATIDLTNSPLYFEHREARPYLLLLTPVTVLVDGVEVVGLFTVGVIASGWWVCFVAPCYQLRQ